MLYSIVHIKPSEYKKIGWEVKFENLKGDRVDEDSKPNGLGFFHYPRRKMLKKEAFQILKDYLVERHIKEIAALSKSLEALNKLKCPE